MINGPLPKFHGTRDNLRSFWFPSPRGVEDLGTRGFASAFSVFKFPSPRGVEDLGTVPNERRRCESDFVVRGGPMWNLRVTSVNL